MNAFTGRVLVVDDEEAVREVCARTLSDMGLTVETARDAAEAWGLLNAREYDCVLTDISMPGEMDGAALTEEVRGRFPATDMIIMTGDPTLATAVSTLKRGALDYLIKPFGSFILQSAASRCFERRRLSGQLDRERTMRAELEAAYRELQKAERAKDAFISVLNHELRTPLAIAVSAVALLKEGSDPQLNGKVLEVLRASLARESEVIEDLLLHSSLAAGSLPLNPRELRLDELIRALVDEFRPVWEGRRVRVELRGAPAPFRGDPALLQTAFKHLLLNAVHFNTGGGRVDIEISAAQGRLEVLFADTGIGIAPELRAQIFDRFYQVAEHLTRQVGGLGLGLAIVRRIVEAHGGFVTAGAREGGGSEFRVSLPAGRP